MSIEVKTPGTHAAMWLASGLWVVALFLDAGVVAAHLTASAPAGRVEEDAGASPSAKATEDGALRSSEGALVLRSELLRRVAKEGAEDGIAAAGGFTLRAPVRTPSRCDLRAEPPGELRLKAHGTEPPGPPGRWREVRGEKAKRREGPAPGPLLHRVRPGETLIKIARGYLGPDADWDAVAEANSIEPPYTLQVGREIEIAGAAALETRAKTALLPPVEKEAELAARAAFGAEVNSPPRRAFEPLEGGLRLRHPVWEAFPWATPLVAAAVFAVAAFAAGAYTLATAPRRMRRRRGAILAAWGAASAGGMLFVAGGLGVLAAGWMMVSTAAELVFGVTTAALAGLAAFFGTHFAARTSPRGEDAPAPEFALRFAVALAALLAGAFVLSMIAGWTTPALRSLALPR